MSLAPRDRRLIRLFACLVLGRFDEVAQLRREAPSGEPDRAWRETVLQVHVFAGFPRVVEAFGVFAEHGGLGELEPDELRREPDMPARGRELFERIYQRDAPKVRAFLEAGHPEFAAWIEGHAYGRILSRPGLEAAQRELLAVAALAVLGQERQLASHARGAMRCGATREALFELQALIVDLIPPERRERVHDVLAHFSNAR